MPLELVIPDLPELPAVIDELRSWQDDTAPMQLHPGDIGWACRTGADAVAATLRVWRRNGRAVAIGMLDGPTVLRLTTAHDLRDDAEFAAELVAHLSDPHGDLFPAGEVSVESPNGSALQSRLDAAGWAAGDPWVALRRVLDGPVEEPDCRIEPVGPELAPVQTATPRAAWENPRFTDERWHTMAAAPPYADACTLLAYDDADVPVATLVVWSAGPGRPGLIEPLGTIPEHRRRGYGRALCLAAARWLQERGSSSISVCTMASLTGAIATYVQSGMQREPDRLDRVRSAPS